MTIVPGADLDALLAVQALDTDIDRARHRLTALPERGELAAIDAQLAALDRGQDSGQAELDIVAGRQRELEHTLAMVEGRASEVKSRLYGGTVSATRDLQAMAAELESLTARASELESRVLEVMEEREPLDARVDGLVGEKASLVAARAAVEARLAVRQAEVTAELDALHQARAVALEDVPGDLVAIYERLRQRLGGVGVARLVGSRCGGCHLNLSATELDHLRHQPAGTVTYCEQCERILVPARG